MDFNRLCSLVNDPVILSRINGLLKLKATTSEQHTIARDEELNVFIQQTREKCLGMSRVKKDTDAASLNKLFRRMVGL